MPPGQRMTSVCYIDRAQFTSLPPLPHLCLTLTKMSLGPIFIWPFKNESFSSFPCLLHACQEVAPHFQIPFFLFWLSEFPPCLSGVLLLLLPGPVALSPFLLLSSSHYPRYLDSNLSPGVDVLCYCGQVTFPLWASIFTSIKGESWTGR